MNFHFYTENLQDVINEIAEGFHQTLQVVDVSISVQYIYLFLVIDITEFTSDCIPSLSAMVQLERPHINILSKLHLVTSKKDINKLVYIWKLLLSTLRATPLVFLFIFVCRYFNSKPHLLINQYMALQFQKLNTCFMELVNTHFMIIFLPLGVCTENSIQYILPQIDNCILYRKDAF
nr:GPN-loop GTPase 3 [Ipomoea batatas]